jgi:hypothetical protein
MLNPQCTSASACAVHPFILSSRAGAAAGTLIEMKSFRKLVQWIREEFEAAPDLRLTTREAAAFLGLDLATCERVLVQLLHAGVLDRYADNRYGAMATA